MKKKVKTKKSTKKPTLLDRLPKDEGEYLELQIKMTEKVTQNIETHQYLRDQVLRLKKELDEWKKSNT